MGRLLRAVARWSEAKPKPLVWLIGALVCWLLVGALFALPFAFPALGRTDSGCARISDARTAEVLRLVESWTGLPPGPVPARAYLGPEALKLLPTSRGAEAVGAALRVPSGQGGWWIVVVLPCRPQVDEEMLAILAHELVHVLQHHAGQAWPPDEAPAEWVQRRFLERGPQIAGTGD